MLNRKVVGLPPVKRLGMIRAIICAAALFNALFLNLPVAPGFTGDWYTPFGFMTWIPKPVLVMILGHSVAAAGLKALTVMLLVLAMAGWKTRPMVWAATFFYAIFLGLTQTMDRMTLSGTLALHLLFFLCWLPCDEGFSLERKTGGIQDDNRPSQTAGWAIFLLRMIVVVSFVQAGVTKLRYLGFSVLDPWQIKYWLIYQVLPTGPLALGPFFTLLYFPSSFWRIIAVLLVGVELTFPAVLLSWHLRRIYPLAAAIVVFCAGFSRGDWMPDVLIILAIFYDWDRIFSPPGSRRGLPSFKRPAA